MTKLLIESGRRAGEIIHITKFPWSIGRNSSMNLHLDDEGIWDKHVEIVLKEGSGFYAVVPSSVRALINRVPFTENLLRNGDILQLGAVRIQFRFAETQLRQWKVRELFFWISIVLLFLFQITIIYWLFVQ